MKKIHLPVTILIALLFFSCSSDDDSPHLSQSELLVENRPWIFNHYEVIEIIDAGHSEITRQFIVEDMNFYAAGLTLSFNQNGTLFI
ncbi:hypothetical protein GCM10007103_35200 [Salinimicrobium marinum]|uniref:Uncharacterized protein n=1 Tax=Salinimicrobium marinum TaxID=680283 RepID=A0A918SM45_9FLAO|nr:hypothetical protein [Salinimicrobium marinum]GHA51716.1 hypothetical protein GCM10007103_35200 [Salinimicrobium marinum]